MRIAVSVMAEDSISRIGIAAQLRGQPRVHVVDDDIGADPDVVVIAVDGLDEAGIAYIRSTRLERPGPFVLVIRSMDEHDILLAGQSGASAVVCRNDATSARLIRAIDTAFRSVTAPDDQLGCLVLDVDRLVGASLSSGTARRLRDREAEVLRLVADGFDTNEVATQLAYSERTVKNVLHDVTTRFHLRNRCHAVAFALRQGLI